MDSEEQIQVLMTGTLLAELSQMIFKKINIISNMKRWNHLQEQFFNLYEISSTPLSSGDLSKHQYQIIPG